MSDKELTPRELNCIFKTKETLFEYVVEMRQSNTTDKNLLKALKHIEKAMDILEEVSESHICVLYGPPEAIFSPKELAEMRLRDEIIQQVGKTDLTAEQWRGIIVDLVSDESFDCRLILDLVNEKRSHSV